MPYKDLKVRREKQKEYSKKHYNKNKTKVIKKNNANRDRVRGRNIAFVQRVLRSRSCTDCGCEDSRVLEFDHVRGEKVQSISNMVYQQASIDKIKKEMRKCEIRCANCHRIVTQERRNAKKAS